MGKNEVLVIVKRRPQLQCYIKTGKKSGKSFKIVNQELTPKQRRIFQSIKNLILGNVDRTNQE